jgi:5-methylcytosine-specific restriction endonuclease McrA
MVSGNMSRESVLMKRLHDLKSEYGSFHLKRAIKELNRCRAEVSNREKRKRFPWPCYRKLYNRQRGLCPLCGEVMPFIRGEIEMDHRDPNRKDFNSENNLQVMHKRCNRVKASKSVLRLSKESGRTIKDMLAQK